MLKKQACIRKIAASILIKLFINGNEVCHTTDLPLGMSGTLFSNQNMYMYMYYTFYDFRKIYYKLHNDLVLATFYSHYTSIRQQL